MQFIKTIFAKLAYFKDKRRALLRNQILKKGFLK